MEVSYRERGVRTDIAEKDTIQGCNNWKRNRSEKCSEFPCRYDDSEPVCSGNGKQRVE